MRQKGFTLIELLVVMVLLGLLSGIAVTSLGGNNQGRELSNEVNRLHAVLRMASDEAIFNNEEIGVVIEEDQYEFLTWNEQESQWENPAQPFLRAHIIPEWVTLDFEREGKKREILGTTENVSDFSGFNEGEEVSPSKTPDLMLLSSGEVTGFTIGLQIDNDPDSRLEIKTTEQGEIILPHVEERKEQDF